MTIKKSSRRFRLARQFTAIIQRDGKWFIAFCPGVPGANGQGETIKAAKDSLKNAIQLIFADRIEDARRGLPGDAIQSVVAVGGSGANWRSGCATPVAI